MPRLRGGVSPQRAHRSHVDLQVQYPQLTIPHLAPHTDRWSRPESPSPIHAAADPCCSVPLPLSLSLRQASEEPNCSIPGETAPQCLLPPSCCHVAFALLPGQTEEREDGIGRTYFAPCPACTSMPWMRTSLTSNRLTRTLLFRRGCCLRGANREHLSVAR